MIGSHCTFTYLEPEYKICNLAKRWWKTQCKNIIEQYNFGIRFFDIRVCFTKNRWTLCHGIVNFKYGERTLYDYCLFMATYCPEAIYRIVLEKGNASDRSIFINEASGLCDKFDNLWRVDIKSYKVWDGYVCNNNQKLFDMGYRFALSNPWEYPAHEHHGSIKGLSDILFTDLKEEAKDINNIFSFYHNKNKEMLKRELESKNELWIFDYCTNNYNKVKF